MPDVVRTVLGEARLDVVDAIASVARVKGASMCSSPATCSTTRNQAIACSVGRCPECATPAAPGGCYPAITISHALSRGTQEQLAIVTRLAFADLLLDKQRPGSIVLDDALVYSDDNRLEVMADILADAAKRMQIILLRCRAKAFGMLK